MNDENIVEDWFQANWEILVEDPLMRCKKGVLEVYGDGADCNGDSSRVFLPSAEPTHRIVCNCNEEVINEINGESILVENHPFYTTKMTGGRAPDFQSTRYAWDLGMGCWQFV